MLGWNIFWRRLQLEDFGLEGFGGLGDASGRVENECEGGCSGGGWR